MRISLYLIQLREAKKISCNINNASMLQKIRASRVIALTFPKPKYIKTMLKATICEPKSTAKKY